MKIKRFFYTFLCLVVLISFFDFLGYEDRLSAHAASEDMIIVNGITYVTGGNDCNLEVIKAGKLMATLTGGVKVYEIVGQEDHKWVLVKGGNFLNRVFRREDISPVNFRTMPIEEIQTLRAKSSNGILASTRDRGIIEELMNSSGRSIHITTPYPDTANYKIRLISPHLKGISCYVEAEINRNGEVYIIYRSSGIKGDEYVKAGPKVTGWIKSIKTVR
ncbi:hypothetical protein [Fonticella tunisiensis]|uniref:Uncharacterized protein n=1 Tax=Fonticella tunisiensis TaxID=1096341 RepID=A0A4R7KDV2_9CLOT|nr:hypothetical protein [Fonticella tunisiensis]TDT51223.1 hypothetical protein EDD71_1204 [Fonticella tunisiensis]